LDDADRVKRAGNEKEIANPEIRTPVEEHLIRARGDRLLGSADGTQYRAADAIPLRGDSTLGDG